MEERNCELALQHSDAAEVADPFSCCIVLLRHRLVHRRLRARFLIEGEAYKQVAEKEERLDCAFEQIFAQLGVL